MSAQITTSRPIAQADSLASPLFKPRFDALTSLRFTAAAMIVFLHAIPRFFGGSYTRDWQFTQAVAFFFVLSGFILTCVYPTLKTPQSIKQYCLARLGRIWPSHFITTIAVLCLLPYTCPSVKVLLTNLCLLQAWIPKPEYYFSLNGVAWTLSVEMFFYLSFIWLIRPWKFGWIGKVAIIPGSFLVVCLLVNYFAKGHISAESCRFSFLYISPLARISEFVCGMLTGKLWLRYAHQIHFNKWLATALEIAIVGLVLMEITCISVILPIFKSYPSLGFYLQHNGPSPLFAMLIFVTALQQGYLTKALSQPIFVWLGEISYSIYLVHSVVLESLAAYLPEFFTLNNCLAFFVYLSLIILFSYLNFSIVEDPCRKLARLYGDRFSQYVFSPSTIFAKCYRPFMATVLSAILIIASVEYVQRSQSRFHYTEVNVANTYFDNRFSLEKIYIATAPDGIKIRLTWRSLLKQRLGRIITFQILGADKQWLSQYDKCDPAPHWIHPGQLWTDTIYLPFTALQRQNWQYLGMRLTDQTNRNHWLVINNGRRDFWNTRLIIPIPKVTWLDTHSATAHH